MHHCSCAMVMVVHHKERDLILLSQKDQKVLNGDIDLPRAPGKLGKMVQWEEKERQASRELEVQICTKHVVFD